MLLFKMAYQVEAYMLSISHSCTNKINIYSYVHETCNDALCRRRNLLTPHFCFCFLIQCVAGSSQSDLGSRPVKNSRLVLYVINKVFKNLNCRIKTLTGAA